MYNKEILVGWKAISNYLNVSVTTCKNWVKKYKMPISKTGKRSGTVMTTVRALNEWVEIRNVGK